MDTRVIAIDWSGALQGAAKKIWLAEASDGHLARLESGKDRDALAKHLLATVPPGSRAVIGLDFAFSLPAWYLRKQGWATARELWAAADRDADAWLQESETPFWGKGGKKKPNLGANSHLRRTELAAPTEPKSVFQINGAGSVGTGSLRGMRLLHRLSAAGFSIWPFDPPGWPRVVEIYPRLLTGRVNKSDNEARKKHLSAYYPNLDDEMAVLAASSEDAFDAAVSALVMAANLPDLVALSPTTDDETLLEGLIWHATRNAAAMPPVRRV